MIDKIIIKNKHSIISIIFIKDDEEEISTSMLLLTGKDLNRNI
ncbi:hypothetical protein [Sporocytophaga sp.]|nr:hypothetical protein [Sporocytophaga sp.]